MSLGGKGTLVFVGCGRSGSQSPVASGDVRATSVVIVGVELEVDMYG
jgi:hypothetical protein